MDSERYRRDVDREFRRLKELADRALAQVSDDLLFRTLDNKANSIAIILKHLAGNMRSRWRDFLTTDGEKPDRHRDLEFTIEDSDPPHALRARWEEGWAILFEALRSLKNQDLEGTVTIRGEPLTIVQALQRQMTHYAYHVGQIIFLAKHLTGARWEFLSIPPGGSDEFNATPPPYIEGNEP